MASRLASLVVFAVLAFGSLAQASGLTPDVMNKLERLAAGQGVDRVVSAYIATALGLTVNQGWPSRQLTTDGSDGSIHALVLNRGNEKDLVLYFRVPGSAVHVFRTRRDGMLVRAISLDPVTKQSTTLDVDKAQKELDEEFGYWRRSADKLPLLIMFDPFAFPYAMSLKGGDLNRSTQHLRNAYQMLA